MKRTLQVGGALASALVIAGCTIGSPTRDSATDTATSTPSPTPTVFAQNLGSGPTGDAGTIAISEDSAGEDFGASNIGISFEATDLADPRLDPAASNLDDLLTSLGSPALRFGGNGLDRRTFWSSTGDTAETRAGRRHP